MKKMIINLNIKLVVLLYFALFSLQSKAQNANDIYSHNFVLRGKIMDGETGQLLINKSFTVLAFDRLRTVLANEKGEYLIKFFDTTGTEYNDSYSVPDGELIFISNQDPNKMHTLYLKRTKIKKSNKKDDCTGKPELLTINIKLEFDFD